MGGASAFGPKADIQVLKLTIGLAIAWVIIACTGIFFNRAYRPRNPIGDEPVSSAKKDEKASKGTDKNASGSSAKNEHATGDSKVKPADKKQDAEKNPPEENSAPEKKKPGTTKSDAAADKKEAPAEKPAASDKKADESKAE
jgi:hypothetical protein